jgi:hypothetical protein
VCPAISWPRHQAEIYRVGRIPYLMICQHCGLHRALSPREWRHVDDEMLADNDDGLPFAVTGMD